jgi:Zn ribbon nucleic-acid-binding protein
MASLIPDYNNDISSYFLKKDNKAAGKDAGSDIERQPGINKITRRRFVKGVAGAAVCYACFSPDCLATREDQKTEEGKVHLAAVCGTYCGACPAYIAKHSTDEQKKARL